MADETSDRESLIKQFGKTIRGRDISKMSPLQIKAIAMRLRSQGKLK